ncbi:MAG: 30S ribosomal protein S27ae [Candidatus Diapherotrites archaeon]|nr:30S ribosomal protein S27ae [Candidatus Diapherotrites archaeon]
MGKKKKKSTERKGKKPKKKHAKRLKSAAYKVEGSKISRKKDCPKCGAGIFLAEHKDRLSCGKCSYTEWKQAAK